MRTLEEQLRALGQHLEAEAPAITTTEIHTRMDTTNRKANTMALTAVEPEAPEQRDNSKRHLLLVAAAVAGLALVAGLIVFGIRADEDPVPADEPEPTLPAVEPESEVETLALPFAGSDVEPGRYETDLLGMPVTFDVPETARLWAATANRVALIDTFSTPDWPVTSRSLSLSRISGWNTREEGVDAAYRGPGSIDPYDIDGWIAANDVVAGELTTTTVAGRQATVVDLELEPAPTNHSSWCPDDQTCMWAASVAEKTTGGRGDAEPLLSTGQVNRFWLITIDGADPLLIQAAASVDDEAWLRAVAETTIDSLELGFDAPPLGAG